MAAATAATISPARRGVLSSVNIRQVAGSESSGATAAGGQASPSSPVRRLDPGGSRGSGAEGQGRGEIGISVAGGKAWVSGMRRVFQELEWTTR